MFIESLMIKGFGKIAGLSIRFERGFNIIYGSNESGKTTLQWFIRGMLFGLRSGRVSRNGLPAPLKRYKPWSGNDYGGTIEYRLDNGSSFRVDRDFERNTAAIYDSTYNNISCTFDTGRDRGLLFADRHLGLNDVCFDKTVLIRQMETRLDDDGSGELLSRLVNLNQTGQEDLSFKRSSEALKEAIKKHIGTDRTSTKPADRIAARLVELNASRKKLTEKRGTLISAYNELQELIISESNLKKKKAYIELVKEPIDSRRQIDEERYKLSELSKAAVNMDETDKALLFAEEELIRLQEKSKSEYNEGITRISTRYGAGGKAVWLVVLLLIAAAGASAILGIFSNPAWFIPAAVLIFAAVGAFLFMKQSSKSKEAELLQKDTHRYMKIYESKMQQIISLSGRFKDICSEASIVFGKQIDRTGSISGAILEKTTALKLLEQKLQHGIDVACSAGADYESGYFAAATLENIITDSGINWLQDSWEYEMEKVNNDLVETALKIKECETLLKGFQEEGDELQDIAEEIAALELSKDELEKTGAALRMALDVMAEASLEIRTSFAPLLNSGMSRIIAGITSGRYVDLKADDSLSLNTVSPDSGDVRNVMVLSGGTTDQMYLALRLAMSDLLSSGLESLPLLLDEVFSQYDDTRIIKTLEYLFNEYMDRQVIIFTCKGREVEAAKAVSGGRLNIIWI